MLSLQNNRQTIEMEEYIPRLSFKRDASLGKMADSKARGWVAFMTWLLFSHVNYPASDAVIIQDTVIVRYLPSTY